jgi:hypothetical protein
MMLKKTLFQIVQVTVQFQFIKFFFHVKMIQSETTKTQNLTIFGCSHLMDKGLISLIELIWVN